MRKATAGWTKTARATALAACALIAGCAGGGGGGDSACTVAVSIEPAAPTVIANTRQPFVATVTGAANSAVTWRVQEANGGTISATGVYTAPTDPGIYHVVATSQTNSCGNATVVVTVAAAPAIEVSIIPPDPVTLETQGSQTFLATVSGTTNTAVTWSVQDGGAEGQIDSAGVYTAPTALGLIAVDVVTATSVVDPTAFAQVQVNIVDSSTDTFISPSAVMVPIGGRVDFTLSAQKQGQWFVDDIPFGSAETGRINATGVYTAPLQMPTSNTAVKTATVDFRSGPPLFLTPVANSAFVTWVSRFLDDPVETLQVDGCNPLCPEDEPNDIVAKDFNGDGLDDLATANSGTGTISILLAADRSHFAAPVRLQVGNPASGDPEALAVADINSDSISQNPRMDLVIADADPNALTVRTRLGRGDGTFENEQGSDLLSNSDPLSITVGYFDSSPHWDVAVANFDNDTVQILQGRGDGSFTPLRTFDANDGIDGPLSITAADFNKDGFDDLAVANSVGDTVSLLLSNDTGGFTVQSLAFEDGSGPSAVAAANLSGIEEFPDLVVTTAQNNKLTVFLNTESTALTVDPRFNPPDPGVYPLSTGATPVDLATGDFNGDAVPDVVVANQGDNSVTTYLFDPSSNALVRSEAFGVGASPQALAVGDFNGDGWDDVAVANSNDDTVTILRNRGGPTAPAP